MMITRATEKGKLKEPTPEQLRKLWDHMVKAVEDRDAGSLAAAKRMLAYGRQR